MGWCTWCGGRLCMLECQPLAYKEFQAGGGLPEHEMFSGKAKD